MSGFNPQDFLESIGVDDYKIDYEQKSVTVPTSKRLVVMEHLGFVPNGYAAAVERYGWLFSFDDKSFERSCSQ